MYVIIENNPINYLRNRTLVKLSIGHKILENMVVVIVTYTPPLALLFIAGLPHPPLHAVGVVRQSRQSL